MDHHESNPDRPEVTPGQASADDAAPAPEPTMGEWLRANVPTLIILGALFVFLYIKFDTDGRMHAGEAYVDGWALLTSS